MKKNKFFRVNCELVFKTITNETRGMRISLKKID